MNDSTRRHVLDEVLFAMRQGGKSLTADTVGALLDAYPYFTAPAAVCLKLHGHQLDEATRHRFETAVALNAPDPQELYMLLQPGCESHASFYPDETPSTPSTESVIDSFLNTYGTTSPEEEEILNRMIFNPTPDYAQVLAKEEAESVPEVGKAPAGSQDDLINRFIIGQKQEAAAATAPAPLPNEVVSSRRSDESPKVVDDTSLLSESLARIFIKQRHYQRAYEIIEQLNLKYPEKSVYFADQLRFLRKLMKNQEIRALRNAVSQS